MRLLVCRLQRTLRALSVDAATASAGDVNEKALDTLSVAFTAFWQRRLAVLFCVGAVKKPAKTSACRLRRRCHPKRSPFLKQQRRGCCGCCRELGPYSQRQCLPQTSSVPLPSRLLLRQRRCRSGRQTEVSSTLGDLVCRCAIVNFTDSCG